MISYDMPSAHNNYNNVNTIPSYSIEAVSIDDYDECNDYDDSD